MAQSARWRRRPITYDMLAPRVATHIAAADLVLLGWLAPAACDGLDAAVRCVVLIGNAGPALFERFLRERATPAQTLDAWTRCTVDPLAATLGARAVYPFDRPHPPLLAWAYRAGVMHPSPLGLGIHPVYGLWHAFRAALLFREPSGLPAPEPAPHPCERCAAKPCLHACPVAAFAPGRYDTGACVAHIAGDAGASCMSGGCRARHACPVGQAFAHAPAQASFHMQAFRAAMRAGTAN